MSYLAPNIMQPQTCTQLSPEQTTTCIVGNIVFHVPKSSSPKQQESKPKLKIQDMRTQLHSLGHKHDLKSPNKKDKTSIGTTCDYTI